MVVPELKSDFRKLNNILYHSYIPVILNASVNAGIFETLSLKGQSAAEMAKAMKYDYAILSAVLDVLYSVGLAEKEVDIYSLTSLSEDFMLEKSGANQITGIRMFSGSNGIFNKLGEYLRDGASSFNNLMWSSEDAALSMEKFSMGGPVQSAVSFVSEQPEFKSCRKMCDVAGSTGYFSLALIGENRDLRSDIYETSEVCSLAQKIRKKEIEEGLLKFIAHDCENNAPLNGLYDIYFCSNFLYQMGFEDSLEAFFREVNRSMVTGGLFISNHIAPPSKDEDRITVSLVELMTRCMGYPTHQLPVEKLEEALSKTGFGDFRREEPSDALPFPVVKLAAVKICEV